MPLLHRITDEDAHRRRWELLALTSIGAFMGPLDGSIVSVALPVMSPDLHLSFAASMWVQAAYLLATAVLLIPLGRLADQHGRVRFYLIGTAVFTAGSLLAALSVNGAWLILSRVIQGGGAALMVATAAARRHPRGHPGLALDLPHQPAHRPHRAGVGLDDAAAQRACAGCAGEVDA